MILAQKIYEFKKREDQHIFDMLIVFAWKAAKLPYALPRYRETLKRFAVISGIKEFASFINMKTGVPFKAGRKYVQRYRKYSRKRKGGGYTALIEDMNELYDMRTIK